MKSVSNIWVKITMRLLIADPIKDRDEILDLFLTSKLPTDTIYYILNGDGIVLWILDDEPVFMCTLCDGSASIIIDNIVTAITYRRRGIASNVLRHLINTIGRLYTLSLYSKIELLGFYSRFGFVEQPRIKYINDVPYREMSRLKG